MTIDEAIKQCLEVADDLTKQADTADDAMILDGFNVDDCRQYIANLRQLAEWLTELKEAKRLLKAAEVQSVKRGEWTWNSEAIFGNPYGSYECSECGNRTDFKDNYCCSCGAEMKNAE